MVSVHGNYNELDNTPVWRYYSCMIVSFCDRETESIYNGIQSCKLPRDIQNVARRKLRMIAAARVVEDLRIPPGNRLEKLSGELIGFYSIRINNQWKIVFKFENGGAEHVGIKDYH